MLVDKESPLSAGCFDELSPSSFWCAPREREPGIHRIHAYPAKFPSFLTTQALKLAQSKNVDVKRIGDIFCGCGTVAYESRKANIDFWGCDINPVATLIARAKSGTFDLKLVKVYTEQIYDAFNLAKETDIHFPADTKKRLDYWYSADQFSDLARLLSSINKSVPEQSSHRLYFHCAFSNILKSTSRWLTKSIKPQVDPSKSPIKPLEAFKAQLRLMEKAFSPLEPLPKSRVIIETGNILKKRSLPSDIDLLVTSPPYVTSYEYADLHQLTSLWLGYAADYRTLRNGSIGSTQHSSEFSLIRDQLHNIGRATIDSLFDADRHIARAAAKYFLDIQTVSRRSSSIVSSNAVAVFIIGNTEYKGVRIDNAVHLVESLLGGGFSQVQVAKRTLAGKILTPYRDEKGKFTRSSLGRHVYGEEFVLVATK